MEAPLYFVDFLREPVCDPETGEVIDGHPSFYESIPGGLPDIRYAHISSICKLLQPISTRSIVYGNASIPSSFKKYTPSRRSYQ